MDHIVELKTNATAEYNKFVHANYNNPYLLAYTLLRFYFVWLPYAHIRAAVHAWCAEGPAADLHALGILMDLTQDAANESGVMSELALYLDANNNVEQHIIFPDMNESALFNDSEYIAETILRADQLNIHRMYEEQRLEQRLPRKYFNLMIGYYLPTCY